MSRYAAMPLAASRRTRSTTWSQTSSWFSGADSTTCRRVTRCPGRTAWRASVCANTRRSGRRHLELIDKVTRLDPPRSYEAPESYDDVHNALAQLSDLDRELVQLWAWEGLPPRDIAASLGMTANAVSIRLTRAKHKLAELLRKNADPSGHEPDEGRTR